MNAECQQNSREEQQKNCHFKNAHSNATTNEGGITKTKGQLTRVNVELDSDRDRDWAGRQGERQRKMGRKREG